jgi:hypothetical protein
MAPKQFMLEDPSLPKSVTIEDAIQEKFQWFLVYWQRACGTLSEEPFPSYDAGTPHALASAEAI